VQTSCVHFAAFIRDVFVSMYMYMHLTRYHATLDFTVDFICYM